MCVCVHVCFILLNRKIAMALLKSPQWPIVLRHTFETDEGKITTPFRELVKKMPGL